MALSVLFIVFSSAIAQELYVFSEPASNMPAKSISAKYSLKLLEGRNG